MTSPIRSKSPGSRRRRRGTVEISEREIKNQKTELAFKAVKDGNVILLQSMLREGLEVNVYRWSGWTLLHRAAGYRLL